MQQPDESHETVKQFYKVKHETPKKVIVAIQTVFNAVDKTVSLADASQNKNGTLLC
jgi:hypothetical protein